MEAIWLTLGNLAIKLDQGLERVVGEPCLGDGDAVFSVDVFAFEVAADAR